MKILKVKGHNLASLENFEIDFEHQVTDKIFAIIGNTGAGKSTILDAVCLALYASTPRSGTDSGGKYIPCGDGSFIKASGGTSIMTRGKNEAFAEVDFIGQQNIRYRAFVRIYRKKAKRNSSEKALKKNMAFNCLMHVLHDDGTVDYEVQNTEHPNSYSKAVEQYIGLSWEQFSKVIILPQGDFMAFLNQDTDEKTVLLEKMTGTGIYQQIHKQLQNRLQEVSKQTNEMEVVKTSIRLMTDEDRSEEEEKMHLCEKELQEKKEVQEKLNRVKECGKNIQKQQLLIAAKKEEIAGIGKRKEELQTDYMNISLYEKTLVCRDDFLHLKNAVDTLKKHENNIEEQKREIQREQQEHSALKAEKERYDSELKTIIVEETEKQPLIQEAEKLEKVQIEAKNDVQNRQKIFVNAENDEKNSLNEKNKQDHELAVISTKLQTLNKDYDVNKKFEYMKDFWAIQKSKLTDYYRLKKKLAGYEGNLRKKKQELADYLNILKNMKSDILTHAEKLEVSLDENQQDNCGKIGLIEQVINSYMSEQGRLLYVEMKQISSNKEKLRNSYESIKKTHGIVIDLRKKYAFYDDKEKSPIKLAEKALEELNREVKNIDVKIKIVELAKELRPGEECPLCGSLEHPKAFHADSLELYRQQREEKLKEVQQCREHIDEERHKCESILNDGRMNRTLLDKETENFNTLSQTVKDSLGLLRDKWFAAVMQSIGSCGDNGVTVLLRDFALAVEKFINETSEVLAVADKSVDSRIFEWNFAEINDSYIIEKAGATDRKLNEFSSCCRAVKDISNNIVKKQQEIDGKGEDIQNTEKVILSVTDDINRLIPKEESSEYKTWQELSAFGDYGEAENGIRKYDEIVTSISEYCTRKEELEEQKKIVSVKVQNAESSLKTDHDRMEKCKKELSEAVIRNNDVAEAHKKLFDGKSSAEVIADLNKRKSAVSEKVTRAESSLKSKQVSLEKAAALLKKMENEKAVQEQSITEAEEKYRKVLLDNGIAVEDALKGCGISVDEYNAAKKNTDEIRQMEEKLNRDIGQAGCLIEQDVNTVNGLKDSLPEGVVILPQVTVNEDFYNKLNEDIRNIEQQKNAHAFKLMTDRENQKKLSDVNAQIEKIQKDHQVEIRLMDLFRTQHNLGRYAQRITYGYLVEMANKYIMSFTGRYSLKVIYLETEKAVDKNKFELVVIDHDTGGLERPICSLSGGEKFRISLGMALGLSDLITGNIKVENMFIDEGFDTLDNERLENLLISLRSIKSDRQIGIISHVEQIVSGNMIPTLIEVRSRGGKGNFSEVLIR